MYSLCFFERNWVVPKVELVDAATDDEAIAVANESLIFTDRELWDRHRLVAVIPARH